ncbi:MAG: BON domain-containing protein, partial [Alphaproteobacteria bacterium]|nr:BON domain-containing protein [Alphaproteobacteria bacterium]
VMDERSIEDDWTDSKINLTLRGKLASTNPAYALDIEITVFEGEVMLNGALPNIEDIERVTEIAWQIEPVTKVYNHIRLKNPATIIDTSKDAYIASGIRTDLMMTQGITSVNYKITVEDNTLYVMGIAADKLEYKRVMNILKSQKGINKIISHVRKSYK